MILEIMAVALRMVQCLRLSKLLYEVMEGSDFVSRITAPGIGKVLMNVRRPRKLSMYDIRHPVAVTGRHDGQSREGSCKVVGMRAHGHVHLFDHCFKETPFHQLSAP